MAHRIRLRKPWTRHDSGSLSPSIEGDFDQGLRVDVPDTATDDLLPTDSVVVNRAVYMRRFNCPSGLQTETRVQLEIGEVVGQLVEVRLNSAVMTKCDEHATMPAKWEITSQISATNCLEIEIESAGDATVSPRLVGEVNLWILDQG